MVKKLIRKIRFAPFIIKQMWLAEDALKKKDWEKLAKLTTQLHQKGYFLDKTRFWLGSALLHLNRNEEALDELKNIEGNLDTIEEEASRHWNHALALYRTNRKDESHKLLMEKIDPDWPTKTFWKARQFLADAGFEAFRIKV